MIESVRGGIGACAKSAMGAQRREQFIPPVGSQGKAQSLEKRLRAAELMNEKAFCSVWRVVKGKLLF